MHELDRKLNELSHNIGMERQHKKLVKELLVELTQEWYHDGYNEGYDDATEDHKRWMNIKENAERKTYAESPDQLTIRMRSGRTVMVGHGTF